ncbi:MAG TPA: hypothetical protein VKG80_06695 [Trebonia sp.]|nr:hypothetical protein [Trebonia sp.]
MAADQVPTQAGDAEPAFTRIVRAVIQPGGKDIDWEKVNAAGVIIGAAATIYGLKNRSWRHVNTAATVLVIGSAIAARLKDRYVKAAEAPENK